MSEEPNPFEAPRALMRFRVSLADMAAAQPVEASFAMELGKTSWRLRFTPEHLYLARDDNPHAHRLSRGELVECGRLRALLGERAVLEFRWPDRERVTLSPEATRFLRRWLDVPAGEPSSHLQALMKKTMRSGWLFDLLVGVLFLIGYGPRASDVVGALAGAVVLGYALAARIHPVRSLWWLRILGWVGIAASFVVAALVDGQSPWLVLLVPLLLLGSRGTLRMIQFFGYDK